MFTKFVDGNIENYVSFSAHDMHPKTADKVAVDW